MLERLSEGDRDKVEAAVSRHGDLRADRLVKDYAARAQRRLKSIDRQFAAAQSKNAALRDAHAARVADDERRALAKVTAATFDGSIDPRRALLIEASPPRSIAARHGTSNTALLQMFCEFSPYRRRSAAPAARPRPSKAWRRSRRTPSPRF